MAFNNASNFAIETFQLPVQNVLSGLSNQEFFCSGSILKSTVAAADHPMTTGLPSEPNLMFQRGPAFEPGADFKGTVLLNYPNRNPLMSGFILEPEKIQKQAALLRSARGPGTRRTLRLPTSVARPVPCNIPSHLQSSLSFDCARVSV